MVVFSPWAFGTTQRWAMQVMNIGGYLLGGLLASKWLVRLATGWRLSPRRQEAPPISGAKPPATRWPIVVLAVLTVLILGYCLTSALNARATYLPNDYRFEYHDSIAWLPHSYDSNRTWIALGNFVALALVFWAARDWLLDGARRNDEEAAEEHNRAGRRRDSRVPIRVRRLLWVICINGAFVALEAILQRTSGTNRLLWLVETRFNKSAAAQFGPYAYRSNAAQYFTLVWPVALGLWWILHHASKFGRQPRSAHHVLLPCALLIAAGPLVSLSRAGAIVGLAGVILALFTLLTAERETGWKAKIGLLLMLVIIPTLGWYVDGADLAKRFETEQLLAGSERLKIWEVGLRIACDFPVFGTGPGTLAPVYQLYRDSLDQDWPAQLHNDWLETLITFGCVGFALVLLALSVVLSRWFFHGGIPAPRVFMMFLWIALGGCLAHAAVDFPFQIYSILFLFLVLCAILSCCSRTRE